MGAALGHNLVTDDLVIALDDKNPRCKSTAAQTTWDNELTKTYNMTSGLYFANSDLGTDFDGVDNITYCTTFYIHSHHTSYSHSPMFKYGGTADAFLRLYDFGNTDTLGYLLNGGGVWKGLGSYYANTTVGTYLNYSLQYDAVSGAQTWANGVKYGSATATPGTIATNTDPFYFYPTSTGGVYAKIASVYVYLRTLTDAEMIQNFNATRGIYGL